MKLNKLNVAMWLSLGSMTAQPVFAQADTTELLNITVSASPVNDREIAEIPSQVNVLAKTDKQAQESASLGGMLEVIPGVNNQSTGGHAGRVVIRGLNGDRIKILSNGQSTDFQEYGIRHIQNMDPYLAERIEVIRGPQSVLFGSDAIGGVVNVLQDELNYGKPTQGQIAAEYNSNNQEKMLAAKVGSGSEEFAFNGGIVVRDANNFRVPTHGSQSALFTGEVPFTNYENRSANIGLGYQKDWGKVEFRYTDWNSKQNYLGLKSGTTDADATGQNLQNSEAQLTAEIFTDSDWVVKPSWSLTRNLRQATPGTEYEEMSDDLASYLDILVNRNDVKLAFEHPAVGDFEGEFGFEVTDKQQKLRDGTLTPTADENKRAIYLFEEANLDKWLIQFGLRYDWHSVKAPINSDNQHFINKGIFDDSNNQQDYGVATGSLGATYRIDQQWSLATNIGKGFRAPSIFELYAGGIHGGVKAYQLGNPDLEAETSVNVDLSLRWQTANTKMVLTAYQNTIDNYIYLANEEGSCYKPGTDSIGACPGGLQVMKAQQDNAKIHGVEFAMQHDFNSQWSSDLGVELIKGENTADNEELPLMPASNARIAVHYKPIDFAGLKKQKFSVNAKFVDAKNVAGSYEPFSQFENSATGTASTDAYTVWGLAYQAEAKLNQQTVKLYANVDNLFDTSYVDFLNTYKGYSLNQGRNIKLGARVDF